MGLPFPSLNQPPTIYSPTGDDGFYRILVLEHEGDTRGNPWYSKITCVLVDTSVSGTPVSSQGDATGDTPTAVPPPLNGAMAPSDPPDPAAFYVPGSDTPVTGDTIQFDLPSG